MLRKLQGLALAALLAFSPTLAAASVTLTGAGKAPSGGGVVNPLDLQFASGTYAKGGTSYGALTSVPGASVTTPAAFAFNSASSLVAASANAGRIGTAGLLIEESSVNVLVNTNNFTAAAWTVTGTPTVTNNFAVAPDGTTTAGRIQTTADSQGIKETIGSANTWTVSAYLKSNSGTVTTHWYLGGDQTVNPNTTWQLLSVTGTTSPDWNYYVLTASGVTTDVNVWAPQLEQKGFTTSPIPNTASSGTGTRAADDISVASITEPSVAFHIDCAFTTMRAVGQARTLLDWNDGTDNNKIILTMDSTNHLVLTVINGGTPTVIATEGGSPAAARSATATVTWDGTNWGLKVNGSTVATTAAAKPTVTTVQIGQNRAKSQAMNDLITSLTIYGS